MCLGSLSDRLCHIIIHENRDSVVAFTPHAEIIVKHPQVKNKFNKPGVGLQRGRGK